MSDFENMACKAMAVILIILLCFLSVQLMGCATGGTTVGWTDNGAPIVRAPSSFPLLDNRGILHEYRESYNRVIKPSHNDELQVYCGVHRQWETLRIAWKRGNLTKIEHREEVDYWRWNYSVRRSKKQ